MEQIHLQASLYFGEQSHRDACRKLLFDSFNVCFIFIFLYFIIIIYDLFIILSIIEKSMGCVRKYLCKNSFFPLTFH